MESFKYECLDLDKPTIRLLRLCKGTQPDIECELFQAWLDIDDLISYEAL